MAMVTAWIDSIDAAMARDLPQEVLASRKIREKIRDLVLYRLDAVAGQEEAMRRALSIGSMPQNVVASMRGAWRSADLMWRLAGDAAALTRKLRGILALIILLGIVQAAVIADQLAAGAHQQVKRVAEDHVGAGLAQFFRRDRLDRAVGADGHEGRRFDLAPRQADAAAAGRPVGGQEVELQRSVHSLSSGSSRRSQNIASP